MYAARRGDSLPNRDDLRAAHANYLDGFLSAQDPDGKLGLCDMLRSVWRRPKAETQDDTNSGPVPPTQGPVAEAAGADAPAANALTQALEPFAKLARSLRHSDDEDFAANGYDTVSGDIVTVTVADVRALLRAGGLLTDDMLPEPQAAAAGTAGGDKPPAGDVPFNDDEMPF